MAAGDATQALCTRASQRLSPTHALIAMDSRATCVKFCRLIFPICFARGQGHSKARSSRTKMEAITTGFQHPNTLLRGTDTSFDVTDSIWDFLHWSNNYRLHIENCSDCIIGDSKLGRGLCFLHSFIMQFLTSLDSRGMYNRVTSNSFF